jgi:transcriptional regulator with XRE-family HTH domain
METINKVIEELLKQKNRTDKEIAADLGISPQRLGQYKNGIKTPGIDFIQKWKKVYNEDLIAMVEEKETKVSRGTSDKPGKKKRVPFYDIEAEGGTGGGDISPVSLASGTIDVGDLLIDSEAAIRISGNSMMPNYPPGCVVGLIKRFSYRIDPGEVYVVETRDDRKLKRLFYKDDDSQSEVLTCYSDNIMQFQGGPRDGRLAYPPYELHRKEILALYTVVGVIKRNTNSLIVHKNESK